MKTDFAPGQILRMPVSVGTRRELGAIAQEYRLPLQVVGGTLLDYAVSQMLEGNGELAQRLVSIHDVYKAWYIERLRGGRKRRKRV